MENVMHLIKQWTHSRQPEAKVLLAEANCTDLYELRKLLHQFLGSKQTDHTFNTQSDYTGDRTLHRAHLQATKASYPKEGKLDEICPELDRDLLNYKEHGEENLQAYHEAYVASGFKHPPSTGPTSFKAKRTFALKTERAASTAWENANKKPLKEEIDRLRTALTVLEVDASCVPHPEWKAGTPPEEPAFYNIKGKKYHKTYTNFNRVAWAEEIHALTKLLADSQQATAVDLPLSEEVPMASLTDDDDDDDEVNVVNPPEDE
jgi:hypothetical protein